MAFMMTKKNRETRYPYVDGVAITIRSLTEPERAKFELELNRIRGTKGYNKKFDKLLKQVAVKLITRFEGIVDEDGQAIELPVGSEKEAREARELITAEFVADAETRKYWYRPLSEYLYPPKADEEVSEDELEEGEEPNF